jgi:hypothetical protein
MPRFVDGLQEVDKAKLLRLIIYGLILTVVGLSIMMVCRSISMGAADWVIIQDTENQMNFWNNMYGINEFNARASDIDQTANWMRFQSYIFGAVGRVALNFGMLMAMIGLFGFAINKVADDKTRLVCLVTACAVLFALIISTTFLGSSMQFVFM